MSATGTLELAKVFKENIFSCYEAPSLIHYDRDPRFMSEVFQNFVEMMARYNLRYRPQANGQEERRVKTMNHTVRVYEEYPLLA